MTNTPPLPDAHKSQGSSVLLGDHPPTFAGAVAAPAHASTWPLVIGILSMALGSLAVLNAIWASAWALLGPGLLDMINATNTPQFAASSQQTRESMPYVLVSSILSLVLATWLIVAGACVNARRQSGVRLSVKWAWAKIAYAVAATVIGGAVSFSQIEATKQQMAAQGAPVLATSVITISIIFGLAVNMLWLMVYPVFTLIWFKRASIRSTVANWSD